MTNTKVSRLRQDITEADVARISAQVEASLASQHIAHKRVSLSYLKFAFVNRRAAPKPAPVATTAS